MAMRIRYTVLLAGLLALVGWSSQDGPDTLLLQPESKIWIDGTSSLHDWTCEVGGIEGTVETAPAASFITVEAVAVTVPVAGIECHNGTMNGKARKALQADAHPALVYQLETAEVLPAAEGDTLMINTTGQLTIAGATLPVETTVQGEVLPEGRFRFSGSVPLKMKDFGVKPPSALLGTLKTGNDIVVRFEFVAAPGLTTEAAIN